MHSLSSPASSPLMQLSLPRSKPSHAALSSVQQALSRSPLSHATPLSPALSLSNGALTHRVFLYEKLRLEAEVLVLKHAAGPDGLVVTRMYESVFMHVCMSEITILEALNYQNSLKHHRTNAWVWKEEI
ncbi:hypothetical protein LguiB_017582 [Lonicera macranthoides]